MVYLPELDKGYDHGCLLWNIFRCLSTYFCMSILFGWFHLTIFRQVCPSVVSPEVIEGRSISLCDPLLANLPSGSSLAPTQRAVVLRGFRVSEWAVVAQNIYMFEPLQCHNQVFTISSLLWQLSYWASHCNSIDLGMFNPLFNLCWLFHFFWAGEFSSQLWPQVNVNGVGAAQHLSTWFRPTGTWRGQSHLRRFFKSQQVASKLKEVVKPPFYFTV